MRKLVTLSFLFLALLAAAQSPQQIIKLHYHRMDSLWEKDKYAELITYAKAVAPFFKENNKYPMYDYYRLLISYLADAYIENGDYNEAEQSLLQSLVIIEKEVTRMHPVYSDGQYELGKLFMVSGRYSRAHAYYAQAWRGIEFWRKFRWWKYIKTGNELINICASTGKYQEAEVYANKIEATIPEAGYTNEEMVDYYTTRALLYAQMMSVYKAELYIKKANAILPQTSPNIFTLVELKNIMAMIYMASGRKDSAAQILTDLLQELESRKMKNTDASYLSIGNLASVFFIAGKFASADSLLATALNATNKPANKFLAALYMNRSILKLHDGMYDKALEDIDSALSLVALHANDEVQLNLPAKILKSIILLKMNKGGNSLELYNMIMAGYIRYIRENIGYLSESEKNNQLLSYYNLANFFPSYIKPEHAGNPDTNINRAWEQHLFFKGLAAGEQTKLYNGLKKHRDSTIRELYTEWRELKQFIHGESQKPRSIRSKNLPELVLLAEQKEKKLAITLPALKSNSDNKVLQLSKYLKPGEALIDFTQYMRFTHSVFDSIWYGAFVLSYNHPQPAFINLCSEDYLTSLFTKKKGTAGDYLPGLLYPPDALNKKRNMPGNELYRVIWEPLEPYLDSIRTIYIVNDGLLYKVAFHALPLKNGGYLSDKLNIHYLYHAERLCDSTFRSFAKPTGIQCWGGIRYDTLSLDNMARKVRSAKEATRDSLSQNIIPDKLEYLPGTLKEIQAIGRLCNNAGIPVELFSDKEATELKFKTQFPNDYDIVHISTHGRFDPNYFKRKPDFQLYSNLRFSPVQDPMNQVELFLAGCKNYQTEEKVTSDGNDGRMQGGEIAQLDASGKKLVVLTACESGSGDIISAEGVFGMVRAFKLGGAERVIISLWEADDAKAGELLIEFYKNLLTGISYREAFTSAQKYMRNRYPPYYWAGFVLVE